MFKVSEPVRRGLFGWTASWVADAPIRGYAGPFTKYKSSEGQETGWSREAATWKARRAARTFEQEVLYLAHSGEAIPHGNGGGWFARVHVTRPNGIRVSRIMVNRPSDYAQGESAEEARTNAAQEAPLWVQRDLPAWMRVVDYRPLSLSEVSR